MINENKINYQMSLQILKMLMRERTDGRLLGYPETREVLRVQIYQSGASCSSHF